MEPLDVQKEEEQPPAPGHLPPEITRDQNQFLCPGTHLHLPSAGSCCRRDVGSFCCCSGQLELMVGPTTLLGYQRIVTAVQTCRRKPKQSKQTKMKQVN